MATRDVALISTSGLIGLTDFVSREFGARALAKAYRSSGLPQGAEKVLNGFVPETAILTFINEAARLSGDENAGLLFGAHVSFDAYGTWGQYLLQAQSLSDCLERLKRLIPLHTPDDRLRIRPAGDLLWIRHSYATADLPGYRNLAFATIGILIDLCRHYLGRDWVPPAVSLDIPRPRPAALIEDALPTTVLFGAPSLGVAIPRDALRAKRSDTSCSAVTFTDVLRERGPRRAPDFIRAIDDTVFVQAACGSIRLEETARMFDIGVRRLQRALDREGLCFRDVASAARMRRARDLIRDTSLPLKAVAAEVGYAHLPSFTRAFRKQHGLPPSHFRCSRGSL